MMQKKSTNGGLPLPQLLAPFLAHAEQLPQELLCP